MCSSSYSSSSSSALRVKDREGEERKVSCITSAELGFHLGFQGKPELFEECFCHILSEFSNSRNGGQQRWILHQL